MEEEEEEEFYVGTEWEQQKATELASGSEEEIRKAVERILREGERRDGRGGAWTRALAHGAPSRALQQLGAQDRALSRASGLRLLQACATDPQATASTLAAVLRLALVRDSPAEAALLALHWTTWHPSLWVARVGLLHSFRAPARLDRGFVTAGPAEPVRRLHSLVLDASSASVVASAVDELAPTASAATLACIHSAVSSLLSPSVCFSLNFGGPCSEWIQRWEHSEKATGLMAVCMRGLREAPSAPADALKRQLQKLQAVSPAAYVAAVPWMAQAVRPHVPRAPSELGASARSAALQRKAVDLLNWVGLLLWPCLPHAEPKAFEAAALALLRVGTPLAAHILRDDRRAVALAEEVPCYHLAVVLWAEWLRARPSKALLAVQRRWADVPAVQRQNPLTLQAGLTRLAAAREEGRPDVDASRRTLRALAAPLVLDWNATLAFLVEPLLRDLAASHPDPLVSLFASSLSSLATLSLEIQNSLSISLNSSLDGFR